MPLLAYNILTMEHILIVEDDSGISNSLKLYLENSNFNVAQLFTWEYAVDEIIKEKYDLVILDINLPVKNGIEICKAVRIDSSVPIIMLTARNSELDKISGLEIGADDYVSKPFSPRELVARIQTVLRRTKGKDKWEKILKFQDIEINIDKYILTKAWVEIAFTKNEFDIFKKIVEEDGKVVEREKMMKEIIGYDNYAFDRTIDTHIKNIRRKLGTKDLILTVHGTGYRLNK